MSHGFVMSLIKLEGFEAFHDPRTDTRALLAWRDGCERPRSFPAARARLGRAGVCCFPAQPVPVGPQRHVPDPLPCPDPAAPAGILLAFRGTASKANVASDIKAWKVPLDPPCTYHGRPVKVHAGAAGRCARQGGCSEDRSVACRVSPKGHTLIIANLPTALTCFYPAPRLPARLHSLRRAGAPAGAHRGAGRGVQPRRRPQALPHRSASPACSMRWCDAHCIVNAASNFPSIMCPACVTQPFPAGHSLGGALAVLAAHHLRGLHPSADLKLYTFGAPKVGLPAGISPCRLSRAATPRVGSCTRPACLLASPPRAHGARPRASTQVLSLPPPAAPAPQVGNSAFAEELRAKVPDSFALVHDQDPIPRVPASAGEGLGAAWRAA